MKKLLWYVLFVFCFLTSIGLDIYFISLFFRQLNYNIILQKKKHPTLSSIQEIGIFLYANLLILQETGGPCILE